MKKNDDMARPVGMGRGALAFLGLVLWGAYASCPCQGASFVGTGEGFYGEVSVVVETEPFSVQVEAFKETPLLGQAAASILEGRMQEASSPEVEAVSGATITSQAVHAAASTAFLEAGLLPAGYVEEEEEAEEPVLERTSLSCDVVVVGAGGAGLSAALEAAREGAKVLVVEKCPLVGGNALKALTGINAAFGEEEVELLYEDTLAGEGYILPPLARYMAVESEATYDWLLENGLSLPVVGESGESGHAFLRSPADAPMGEELIRSFTEKLSALGVEVLCNVEATSILMDGARAVGILARDSLYDYTIHAGAVVLATGGFASGTDLLLRETEGSFSKAQMDLAGESTGDGLLMAMGVGALVEGLEEVDLVPGVLKEKGFVLPALWKLFDGGALLFNSGGRRFCDETAGNEEVARALLGQDGYFAYLLFDEEMAANWPYLSYVPQDLIRSASSIEELAQELGLAEYAKENLVNAVLAWNQEAQSDSPSLSREKGLGPGLLRAPFYGAKIYAGIIHTMGGVCIDEEARVLGRDGEAFTGLFAAGEVCGGIHGKQVLEGNPLLDVVTFGRRAGKSAAALSLDEEERQ